jgi:hypothetical protein
LTQAERRSPLRFACNLDEIRALPIEASNAQRRGTGTHPQGDIRMLDLILICLGLGFFALSIAYVYACDRL